MIALACASVIPAGAATAATQTAAVSANIVKPLTLTAMQSLDLGTIALGAGTWSNVFVGISQLGVVTCPATNLTCIGAMQVAKYKVTGTNKMVVLISAPDVIMTNQLDPSQRLTLVVDAPRQVTLTSSGEPGITFPIGGKIAVSSTTAGGDYVGTFNVTVDYQ